MPPLARRRAEMSRAAIICRILTIADKKYVRFIAFNKFCTLEWWNLPDDKLQHLHAILINIRARRLAAERAEKQQLTLF